MNRVLVLAHRQELITQAVGHAKRTGATVGMEMGSRRCRKEQVVVSSVQTLNAKRKCDWCSGVEGNAECEKCHGSGKVYRVAKFDPREFKAIIIDEGHHATAKSYRRVIRYFMQGNPHCNLLLVTATPNRSDGTGLKNVCDSVAYEMDLRTAIDEGWLCPIRQQFAVVEHFDLRKVGTKPGGDLKDGELEDALLGDASEHDLHEIALPIVKIGKGRQTIVFLPGVRSAELITAALNSYDGITAEFVHGGTPDEERKSIVERYKRREINTLVNCMVFTEGFDAPGTEMVVIGRNTTSISLLLQMFGRATRPLPGIVDGPETAELRKVAIANSDKPYCLVLDLVGVAGSHKLVTVADALAGDDIDHDDVSMVVEAAAKSGEELSTDEILQRAKQAREDRERRQEEEKERRRLQRLEHYAEGDVSVTDVDLFGGHDFDAWIEDYNPSPTMATASQVKFLRKLGVSPEAASKMTKSQAGAVITKKKNATGGDFVVTFGKHQGKTLSQLPAGYVRWMEENNIGGEKVQQAIRVMQGQTATATGEVPF